MKGIQVIKVRNLEDLEKAEMAWILKNYSFRAVKGAWVDLPTSKVEKFYPFASTSGKFLTVVHNRVFLEPVTIFYADGRYFVRVSSLNKLF